jgi:Ca2+-binding RTX toxin-like protein
MAVLTTKKIGLDMQAVVNETKQFTSPQPSTLGTSTSFNVRYNVNGVVYDIKFTGTGFTYGSNAFFPDSGTITGATYFKAGVEVLQISSASVTVQEAQAYIGNQDVDGLIARIFKFGDVINGSTGDDVLLGFDGDDILIGGAGNDKLKGDAGSDTASYANAAAAVTVSLANLAAQNTVGAGTDTLESIENLIGSKFNDTLTGNAGNNVFNGGIGNDTINGGDGVDTASYLGAAKGVAVSLAIAGAQNTVGAGTDTLTSIENLSGSALADTLTGNSGNNALLGLGGNDVLNGGLGNDVLDGGTGTDTASYAGATVGVTVNLTLTGLQNTVGAGSDLLRSIDNLIGSAKDDTLTGNGGNNVINGGAGNDKINGGGGIDTVSYAGAAGAVTVNLATTVAQNTVGAGSDTLASMENVIGSGFGDKLTGTTGANFIYGGGGNDQLSGAGGADRFYFDTRLNVSTNVDKILDFNPTDDTIYLARTVFSALPAGALATSAFHRIDNYNPAAPPPVTDDTANDRIIYDQVSGKLYYDADGAGGVAALLFATINNGAAHPTLTSADFIVY